MWKSAQLLKHLLLSGHEYPAIGIILTRVHDRVLIEDAGQNLGCFFELSFGNQVECIEYVSRDSVYPGKRLLPPNNAGNPGLSDYGCCVEP